MALDLFLVESIDGKYQDWIHYSMLRILPKELEDNVGFHFVQPNLQLSLTQADCNLPSF